MVIVLKKIDVVIVGFGWVGVIMVKELIEVGFNVVVLECGLMCDIWLDGVYLQVIDELIYNICCKLFQDLLKSIVIIWYNISQQVVFYCQLVVFLLGIGVGGVGLYWFGVYFCVDFIELWMCSYYEECYGKNFIFQDMIIQDFGVIYDELELFFDKVEKVFGIFGIVWLIKGKVVGKGCGGNVFVLDCLDDFLLLVQKNIWLV